MKFKLSAAILLILAALLVFWQFSSQRVQTLLALGPGIGILVPHAEEFHVQKDLLRQGEGQSSRSIEASNGPKRLKIEITRGLSAKQAEQTIAERLFMIQSLYSNLPSPYPGMVTNTVAVDSDLQPRLQEIQIGGNQFSLYILSSNSRYTYGALNKENVAFMGGLCFLFNLSSGTLYRVDYFIPTKAFNQDELIAFFAGIRTTEGNLTFPQATGRMEKTEQPVAEQEPAAGQPPETESLQLKDYNLILIALEPLGASHVSCYGYAKKTTPALDHFADSAFLFENAESPSSWSLPVFMSWFTSMYPSQHGLTNKYSTFTEKTKVLANLERLSPHAVTMAQVLRQDGYRTAGFTGGASLSRDFGFNLGFEEYFDDQSFGGFNLTMPKALNWLSEHKKEKLFLFVQGYDVHGRFPLEKKYLQDFLGKAYKGPYTGTADEYWKLRDQNIEQGGITLTDEDMRFWRAVYDAKIFAADWRFGDFMRQLKELGLLDNSIIIFSSGSGNEYNEHGRIDHGFSLYEELTHVPFLLRIPGQHGRIPDLVSTIDIMPTVLDLLGLDVSNTVRQQMQGTSLVPLLKGKHLKLSAVSETDYLSQVFKRSIRTADGWKLIVSLDTEKRELYDLNKDPGETTNLIGSEGRRAYEMEQELFRQLRGSSRQQ